ncbi:bifunctional 3'-5' exonuclease/DNA polymerase [Lacisediminihabitans changchengi]|uniref:DNA-directed DNA polymerase n=1 Tax=Lacisediminihabitans changchengi TaxID=2787634 RepID=A0A934VX89_9MICO|nr:bifunctional 3'-5' exonuclease/DNA polymerase [Lacisediminihabitans changchengi]MBK4346652.1 bifunctional 3'-5' exonuclease/DNA polymerase [Lacisediminihabitans changchengi]
MYVALFESSHGAVLQPLDESGLATGEARDVGASGLAAAVAELEAGHPRWVWDDTSRWYPRLLAEGVRIERCVDLRLSHAILRNSALTASSTLARSAASSWDRAAPETVELTADAALFDFDGPAQLNSAEDTLAEFALQRAAIAGAADPARLGLLLAAESAGALVAAEILYAGLPWREDVHDAILARHLGPRPAPGVRPAKLQAVLERLREALDAPTLNPDSPPELLKALARAGLIVRSTRSWELKKLTHPSIEPLLEYKKLARLLSANGWHWLDTNVRHGRFHPEYVPGGVVTGRWASKGGGGALQLPKQIRSAVVADPGWKLVVADASQLEPRILAALSGDRGMAEAGAAGDLYAGIVASGAVATRDQAKVAMLGAMYGATTGESGRLMPALTRAYPRAIGLVETAARAGEKGEIVSTRLGRSSPPPGPVWRTSQSEAYGEGATDADVSRARGQARSWGRFTRNFVVQGSAAEWALCWMATLRGTLDELGDGAWLTDSPHLVFFMHDEVVVHCPADAAASVEAAVRESAAQAGRLLFGAAPVTFPLTVAVVDDYGQAK